MNTVIYLLAMAAKGYEFAARVLLIAIGWAILWGHVQLLVMLAWGL
ncbi:hypothetical protein [Nonomuraea sp. NPDC005650]